MYITLCSTSFDNHNGSTFSDANVCIVQWLQTGWLHSLAVSRPFHLILIEMRSGDCAGLKINEKSLCSFTYSVMIHDLGHDITFFNKCHLHFLLTSCHSQTLIYLSISFCQCGKLLLVLLTITDYETMDHSQHLLLWQTKGSPCECYWLFVWIWLWQWLWEKMY